VDSVVLLRPLVKKLTCTLGKPAPSREAGPALSWACRDRPTWAEAPPEVICKPWGHHNGREGSKLQAPHNRQYLGESRELAVTHAAVGSNRTLGLRQEMGIGRRRRGGQSG